MPSKTLSLALFAVWVNGSQADQEQVNEKGKVVQSMKIEAPAMSEEDNYGYSMPDQYKCDACRAVMYHLTESLSWKQPKSRRLQEWEYQDIFDETCAGGFKGYGIKLVDGKNVLSGPGLKHEEQLQPGMGAIQMGGEKWEKRLGEVCRKLVYETIGEDKLYEHFRSAGKLSESLCHEATRVCHTGAPTRKADKLAKTSEQASGRKVNSKKDRKTKSKAQPAGNSNGREERSSVEGRSLDVAAFLTELEKEHGLPTNTYTKKRTRAEWEKTILQMAGRLYTKSAAGEPVTQV